VCVCVCTNTTNQCTFPPHLAGHTISAANGRKKNWITNYLVSKRKKLIIVRCQFLCWW